MPFTYRSKADQRHTFAAIQRNDGSTVELESGETFVSRTKVEHPLLELISGKDDSAEGGDSVSDSEKKTPAHRPKS